MGGREVEPAFRLDNYDYHLPEELIAQFPSPEREASRLLVLDRSRRTVEHLRFEDISGYLEPGDVLVVNDTRVVPARLCGSKETGGRVELLVLDPYIDPELGGREGYTCLLKSAKRAQPGSVLTFGSGPDAVHATVLTAVRDGKAQVRFQETGTLLEILERVGQVPLPPYIRRGEGGGDPEHPDDAASYQTVYAAKPGAVAAPTAGLHFSERLLEAVRGRGIELVRVTLHVGYGTFAPLRVEDIREHRMHPEYAEISRESAALVESARREGRRVVAVGTTVVRILEWVMSEHGSIAPFSGLCNHYIYPGYRFGIVGSMVTNFHLPKSTLLLLVSAFAGRETVLAAYEEAVREGYRFFSYGDGMLIL